MSEDKTVTDTNPAACDIDVPDGYTAISTGAVPPAWEPEVDDVLEGEIMLMKKATVQRGRESVETQFLVIENGGELITIWESAGNKELFAEVSVGDRAYIKYTGLIPLDKGRNPMHGYTIGVKHAETKSNGKA